MSHTGIVVILATLAVLAFGGLVVSFKSVVPRGQVDQPSRATQWETSERLLNRCAATLDDPTFVTNKRMRDIYDRYCP